MTPSSNAPSDAEGLLREALKEAISQLIPFAEDGDQPAISAAIDNGRAALRAAPASGGGGGAMREATALIEGLKVYPTLGEDDPHGAKREAFIQGYLAALAVAPQAQEVKEYEPLVFKYKNHRGEDAIRIVSPMSVRFGTTEWHKKPQWLMKAFDHEKRAEREFAMSDINALAASPPSGDAVRALEPFAAVAKVMEFYTEDSMPVMIFPKPACESQYPDEPRCVALTPSDFHNAARVLASLPPRGDAVREALEQIIAIDQHEKFTTIECDPAGNTQQIDVVDGPCAIVARAALALPSSGAGRKDAP